MLGQRGPVRRVRDHFVAGPEERQRRVVERLLAPGGDNHLGVAVFDAVVGLVAIADGALQIGDAADRRVAREVRVERGVRGALHQIRRGEIGLTGPEVDHFDAGPAHPIHGGGDLHRRRRGDSVGAIREFHLFTFSRRRASTSCGTSPCTRPPSETTSLISRELM